MSNPTQLDAGGLKDASTGLAEASVVMREDAATPRPDVGQNPVDAKETLDVQIADATVIDVLKEAGTGDAADADGTTDAADSGQTKKGEFFVVRIGDWDGHRTGVFAAPAFLDEYTGAGQLVRTVAVPAAASANQAGLVMQVGPVSYGVGYGPFSGFLTRSADGRYLVLAGYEADHAAETTATPPVGYSGQEWPRVIARVDAVGNVDTSTRVEAFGNTQIGGAATVDGTSFWSSGGRANMPRAGVFYSAFGAQGTGSVLSDRLNTTSIGIFAGQLYVAASGADSGIWRVGTSLPTAGEQTLYNLVTMPNSEPLGFFFVDADGKPGMDTLYVADRQAGVIKFVANTSDGGGAADAGLWTPVATFTDGIAGAFGVVAIQQGSKANLFVTSAAGDKVVRYVDDGIELAPRATVVATAPPLDAATQSCLFRGVALSPFL